MYYIYGDNRLSRGPSFLSIRYPVELEERYLKEKGEYTGEGAQTPRQSGERQKDAKVDDYENGTN